MSREIKDLKIKEVSLVDKAANKKKFLFFKQENGTPDKGSNRKLFKKNTNIVIDSDGTVKGTKISVNGSKLKDIESFSFSFWRESENISCSFSALATTEDGFSRSETFYLAKGDSKMDENIQKQLKVYFDEDEVIEKAEDNDVITKALDTVNDYRGEFPDDLKKAVGIIAKQAALYTAPVEKKAEETKEVEKAGAKFSKDTLKKIQDALATLKSLMPQLAEKKDDETDGVEKTVGDLTKTVEKIEKDKTDNTQTKLNDTLAELAKRIETVEKGTGVRKSLNGYENDTEDSDGKKWPSLS